MKKYKFIKLFNTDNILFYTNNHNYFLWNNGEFILGNNGEIVNYKNILLEDIFKLHRLMIWK